MSTPYQDRSAAVQVQIISTGFYNSRYLACLKKYSMTQTGVEKKQYSNLLLHDVWENFWLSLPDNPSIQREPFFMICDLCEDNEDSYVEDDSALT